MKTATLKNGLVLTVREAEKTDAKELLSYLKKIGTETDFLSFGLEGVGIDVVKEEEIITRFKAAPTSTFLVATLDGAIVSVASLSAEQKSRFSHNAEIGISVKKDFWGLGIGTIMMTELIDFARQTKHIEVLHLTVMAENERALKLYQKLGFKEIGRHLKFSRVGERYLDAELMNLYL